MSSETVWSEWLEEAANLEPVIGPRRFLCALSECEDPLTLTQSEGGEEARRVRDAFRADLAPILRSNRGELSFNDADKAAWLDTLGWFLQTLEGIDKTCLKADTLVALLRIAAVFRDVWNRLPPRYIGDNLITHMAALIGATQFSLGIRGNYGPIWEHETLDAFTQADAVGDWPLIAQHWQTIAPVIMPDSDFEEAAACLCVSEKGKKLLAEILDQSSTILPAIAIGKCLDAAILSEIGALSVENRTRFVLVQSLIFEQPKTASLDSGTLENVRSIFTSVQNDEQEWSQWMRALNRYPVRAKCIQQALGESLVGTNRNTKVAYLQAIDLSTSYGGCRDAVATCMSAFRSKAPIVERREFWELTHQRWKDWDFDRAGRTVPLMTVAVSDLDYGLVGYALEVLSEGDLEDGLKRLTREMWDVQDQWYVDQTAFDSARYRVLSVWQIFAYAAQVRVGRLQWELPIRRFLPFDPNLDRFAAMSLGTTLR
ncbi:hypothetical protein [Candidatus Thiosymbion oneisti]|uniref:hypothetical protein n=1 Tax=Candidatus Thiosymbion oneisti TaxID=589554 RepID=UPI000B7FD5D5|nr:hypothetical protein [Candidatus Thiosymbion oneisti]